MGLLAFYRLDEGAGRACPSSCPIRNDSREVAEVFARWLEHPRFQEAFSRVVFAVYDRGRDRPSYAAFAERFGGA